MKYMSITQAMEQGTGTVSVRGWVYRERGSSKVKFVVLRDGSGILQCVIKPDVVGQEAFKVADKLQREAALELTGEIKPDERAPSGFELQVHEFTVVGESHEFPIGKDASPEFLLDKRHLALRSRKMQAMLKMGKLDIAGLQRAYDG